MEEQKKRKKRITMDSAGSLQGSLHGVMQELQSSSTKEKRKSVENLLQLLTHTVEGQNTSVMALLGQHVVCGIMHVTIEHVVTPGLVKGRSSATVRSEVTRPFMSLLEILHKNVPASFLHQPFLWKQGKPLHVLMRHIVEVLGGPQKYTALHDYSSIIAFIMSIDVYRSCITRRTVQELMTQLVDIAKETLVNSDIISESALEQVAQALAATAMCPHLCSCWDSPANFMRSLTDFVVRRHQKVSVVSSLKVEMFGVLAVRRLAEGCQHDDAATALIPFPLVKVLLACWHLTNRRDGWRLETVAFATQQLALVFGSVLHTDRLTPPPVTVNARGASSCVMPPRLIPFVETVHSVLIPAVMSILSAPKLEFSVVSSRELSHVPCTGLQPIFDFAALVFWIGHVTFPFWISNRQSIPLHGEHSAATNTGDREDPVGADTKRRRVDAQPIDEQIVACIENLVQQATNDQLSFCSFRRDTCCMWLHTLAAPHLRTVLCLPATASSLASALLKMASLAGSVVEMPLLHALLRIAPQATLTTQSTVFDWACVKFIPSTGVEADDGQPHTIVYDLVSQLTNNAILHVMQLGKDGDTRMGDVDALRSLVLPSACERSHQLTTASVAKHMCPSLVRFLSRQVTLVFLMEWKGIKLRPRPHDNHSAVTAQQRPIDDPLFVVQLLLTAAASHSAVALPSVTGTSDQGAPDVMGSRKVTESLENFLDVSDSGDEGACIFDTLTFTPALLRHLLSSTALVAHAQGILRLVSEGSLPGTTGDSLLQRIAAALQFAIVAETTWLQRRLPHAIDCALAPDALLDPSGFPFEGISTTTDDATSAAAADLDVDVLLRDSGGGSQLAALAVHAQSVMDRVLADVVHRCRLTTAASHRSVAIGDAAVPFPGSAEAGDAIDDPLLCGMEAEGDEDLVSALEGRGEWSTFLASIVSQQCEALYLTEMQQGHPSGGASSVRTQQGGVSSGGPDPCVVVVCSLQVISCLLHLERCGMWRVPQSATDGTRYGAVLSVAGGVNICAGQGSAFTILQHVRSDHALSPSAMDEKLFEVVRCNRISARGQILIGLQALLELVSGAIAKGSPSLVMAASSSTGSGSRGQPAVTTTAPLHSIPVLMSLSRLFRHHGRSLCSVNIGLWEPSQGILSCIGLIGRKLLDSSLAPVVQADLMVRKGDRTCAASIAESTSLHLISDPDARLRMASITIQSACFAIRDLYCTLLQTDIYLSSSDPLIQASHIMKLVVPILRDPGVGLAPPNETGGDSVQAPVEWSTASPLVLQCAAPLLHVLIALNSDEAHMIALHAVETISKSMCHSQLNTIFSCLSAFGSLQRCPVAWSAPVRNAIGAFTESITQRLREADQDRSLALQSSPPLSNASQVRMVLALAQVIGRCGAQHAERIGKMFFLFTGAKVPFTVRRASACCVSIPFRMFSRVSTVLQELQFNCKDAILSKERAATATALLALCNAAKSAPQLEADVLSYLLETYATRDFAHQSLILRALSCLASANPTAAQAHGTQHDTEQRGPLQQHAANITRFHAVRLIFDWVWRFGHNLEALPVACFGFETLFEATEALGGILLPITLLHMKSHDQSLKGSSSLSNPVVSLLQLFTSTNPSSFCDAGTILRHHLPSCMSMLLVLANANYASPTSRPHLELAEAASYAIEWVIVQVGRQLHQDLCRRHADEMVDLMLQLTGRGAGVSLLRGAEDTAEAAHPHSVTLPFVPFAVTSKAAAQLCTIIEASTLQHFFSQNRGDCAHVLLWRMLRRMQWCRRDAMALCDQILTMQQVIQGWLTAAVVSLPHVFEAAIHILCHLLMHGESGVGGGAGGEDSRTSGEGKSDSDAKAPLIPSAEARGVVCQCLHFVWTQAGCYGASPSPTELRQRREQLLKPHAALVSSTLLSLLHHVEVGKLWTEIAVQLKKENLLPLLQLSNSASVGSLGARQASQAALSASSQRLLESEGSASPFPSAVPSSTESAHVTALFAVLEELGRLVGVPTAPLYSTLAAVIDRQCDVLAAALTRDPVGNMPAVRAALTHFMDVCCHQADRVSMDTRIAAAHALRSLYGSILCASALQRDVISAQDALAARRASHTTGVIPSPADIILSHRHASILHSSHRGDVAGYLSVAFISGVSHDVVMDKAYAEVLSRVRRLCHSADADVALHAATVLRCILASHHDVIDRAKHYVEKHDAALWARIQPFLRGSGAAVVWDSNIFPSVHSASGSSGSSSAISGKASPVSSLAFCGISRSGSSNSRDPLTFLSAGSKQASGLMNPALWEYLDELVALPATDGIPRASHFLCAFVLSFVAHYPALETKFDFMTPLMSLVHAYPPFASLMLPIVMLHALMQPETDTQSAAKQRWSRLLHDHVLKYASKPLHAEVSRAILTAIDMLRCAQTSVVKLHGKRTTKSSKSTAAGRALVKTAAGVVPQVGSVHELCWLHNITHLELANAARECGLVHMSLMYLEYASADILPKKSAMIPVLSNVSVTLVSGFPMTLERFIPFADTDGGAAARRVTRETAKKSEFIEAVRAYRAVVLPALLSCASQLADDRAMEVISNVLRSGALSDPRGSVFMALASTADRSRAVAAGHWTEAIRGADLQVWKGGSGGAAAPITAMADIMSFMSQAACPVTAFQCLAAVSRTSDGATSDALRSALADAAWRSSQWNETGIAPASLSDHFYTKEPKSFSESVAHALYAVRCRDAVKLKVSVRAGLLKIVQQLATAASNGAAPPVLELLLQSQALHELSKFPLSSTTEGRQGVGGATPTTAWFSRIDRRPGLLLENQLPLHRRAVVDAIRAAVCKVTGDLVSWSQQITQASWRYVPSTGSTQAFLNPSVASFQRDLQELVISCGKAVGEPLATAEVAATLLRTPSLMLCRARLYHAIGDEESAVRILQETEGCPMDASLHAEIVRSIVGWANDAQLVPTSQLLNDAGFHRTLGRNEPGGRSSFLMATLCDRAHRDLTAHLQSAEHATLVQSIEESIKAGKELKHHFEELMQKLERLGFQRDANTGKVVSMTGSKSNAHEAEAVQINATIQTVQFRRRNLARDIESFESGAVQRDKDLQTYRSSALFYYGKSLAECVGAAESCSQRIISGNVMSDKSLSPPAPRQGHLLRIQAIFRVVDMWLNHANPATSSTDRDHLSKIPTSCFIPLFTQLAARFAGGSVVGDQQQHLKEILINVIIDYPFHTLWGVTALVNGNRWSPSESAAHTIDVDKTKAARDLLNAASARSPALAQIVKSVEALADAYLELAFLEPTSNTSTVPIKADAKLLTKSRLFQRIPPPTVYVPIHATSAARGYQLSGAGTASASSLFQVPTIVEYKAYFERASGINVPKVLSCVTSSGEVEKQMLKSNDDMRQDALIEQVFQLVNTLFYTHHYEPNASTLQDPMSKQSNSSQRCGGNHPLHVWTYQVVPLGPSTGILQWVNNTITLGNYLVGEGTDSSPMGAHLRYFPEELTHAECRAEMDHKKVAPGHHRQEALRSVMQRFTPVMHHFFTEHFASPLEWAQRRRTYCESAAAMSMVGFIVGLGDRHLNNILIHTVTAELVPIDLGIAFDQGKLLRLPEVVPFRLTRDVVDGMGIQGVDGDFRFACEVSLDIMRRNSELLVTILDAFIHDPLAKWAIDVGGNTAATAQGPQGAPSASVMYVQKKKASTADADRTLLRVRERLRGIECGELTTVESHVQRLIHMATNESNLAAMYEGWSAWV